jgi:uncharacterized Zn finger protein (UPF0148 family)
MERGGIMVHCPNCGTSLRTVQEAEVQPYRDGDMFCGLCRWRGPREEAVLPEELDALMEWLEDYKPGEDSGRDLTDIIREEIETRSNYETQ